MIELLIFYLHVLAALYAFTKNWQSLTIKDGLLAVTVFALMFTIGWAMTGTLSYKIYPKAWESIYFNHNTLSLVLLSIPESFFFYHFYYKSDYTLIPNINENQNN